MVHLNLRGRAACGSLDEGKRRYNKKEFGFLRADEVCPDCLRVYQKKYFTNAEQFIHHLYILNGRGIACGKVRKAGGDDRSFPTMHAEWACPDCLRVYLNLKEAGAL